MGSLHVACLVTEAHGGYGGIATFNRNLVNALCATDKTNRVSVIPRLQPYPAADIPTKARWVRAALGGKARFVGAVVRTLWRDRPDLLLCGHIHLLPAAWLARLLTGAPIWLIIHGVDAWKPSSSRVANAVARRIDRVLAVSQFTRERFLAWAGLPAGAAAILPNCVDLEKFTPGERDLALARRYGIEGKTVMLTVGRLDSRESWKGIDQVLGCMTALIREIPDIVYVVVGQGCDRPRIEARIRAEGLGDRVILTGWVNEEEKVKLYRLADCYVMPGCAEGFGIVYLEAMACGIPVLGSKTDASRELLEDGKVGVVVNPGDRADVTQGIREVLNLPRGVRHPAVERYSWKNFARRVDELLGEFEVSCGGKRCLKSGSNSIGSSG